MRGLALELDCPPTALYSFFKDKHAILTVLAGEIFEELERGLEVDESADPMDILRQGCARYIEFGLKNPDEYRIIFMTRGASRHGLPISVEMLLRENRSFAIKVERVRACVDRGYIRGDTFAAATMLWTMLHGVVSLAIALPSFPFGDVEIYSNRMIDMALHALTSTVVQPLEHETRDAGAPQAEIDQAL